MADIIECAASRFDSAPVRSSRLDFDIASFWRVLRIIHAPAFRFDIGEIELLSRDFDLAAS